MALRKVRTGKDDILRKKSKEVREITPKILYLIDDMVETMEATDGIGLAAVQVGSLKRIVVINDFIGEEKRLYELINPVMLETSGQQSKAEACLSLPGRSGIVVRPEYVKVKAVNRMGEEILVEGEGLLAIALCHELDHLDGVLYTDKMIEEIFEEDDEQ